MQYKIGDRVFAKISKNRDIIFDIDFANPAYRDFLNDTFLIIGIYKDKEREYMLLCDYEITNSVVLSKKVAEQFGVDPKYIDDWIYVVGEKAVGGRVIPDYNATALKCCVCLNFFPYAETNQADGRFACFSCRTDGRYRLIHGIK